MEFLVGIIVVICFVFAMTLAFIASAGIKKAEEKPNRQDNKPIEPE